MRLDVPLVHRPGRELALDDDVGLLKPASMSPSVISTRLAMLDGLSGLGSTPTVNRSSRQAAGVGSYGLDQHVDQRLRQHRQAHAVDELEQALRLGDGSVAAIAATA